MPFWEGTAFPLLGIGKECKQNIAKLSSLAQSLTVFAIYKALKVPRKEIWSYFLIPFPVNHKILQ